ncbi:hypothetical protein [Amycolatopsis pittospori]|uniref:hypothetical protein n=1 Tax=Amycolatopsis pittospori TaxID=2749434 RepID=UPI0015F0A274|nr:hypothetical protein [Amycolatopsis pittospori]
MNSILDELPSDLALTPSAVSSYLGVSGWVLEDTLPGAESWLLYEGSRPHARIILPTDVTFIDFGKRFNEALQRLRRVYDWDSFQLASSILAARSDFFYIRADQLIRNDSIPLKQAEQLISGTLKMMSAAALATIEPRASFPGRRPDAVRNFLDDDVRMGHTQRGSFIITVLTNLDEDDVLPPEPQADENTSKDIEILEDETAPDALASESLIIPPFQRRVTATLANALRETSRITSADHPFASSDSINAGVSSELCESILLMTKFEGLRALDLSFRWAPAERVQPPSVEQVVFDRDHLEPLKNVSSKLKEREDPERMSIIGRVIKLQRSEESDDPNEATVTLRGVVERNNRRQVRVTLSGADHDLAIAAYREQFPIQVTGDIHRTGGVLVLRGAISVEDLRSVTRSPQV